MQAPHRQHERGNARRHDNQADPDVTGSSLPASKTGTAPMSTRPSPVDAKSDLVEPERPVLREGVQRHVAATQSVDVEKDPQIDP